MSRDIKVPAILLLTALLLPLAMAVPTTGAVDAIGDNNATFHATGASGNTWFMWGMYTNKLYLRTPNATPVTGAVAIRVWDFPVFSNTQYFAKACDSSGCGGEVSFTSLTVTPFPTLTLGYPLQNMTESHFDYAFMPRNLIFPATAPFQPDAENLGISIITSLMVFGLIMSQWFRGRNTVIPAFTFMIIGVFVLGADQYAIGPGVLSDWAAMGSGMLAAALAGIIMSLFKKG
jgi:hypothetical protein